jgi:hypothetical protein
MSVLVGSRTPASVLATVLTELPQGLSFIIKRHIKYFKDSRDLRHFMCT